MNATARDWRAQHQPRECEPFETPTDEAGKRKRHMPAPLETYHRRELIDGEQYAAGKLLYEDYVVGVHGVRERPDVDLGIRLPQSQAPGLPPAQMLAGMRLISALNAIGPANQVIVEAVCCHEQTVASRCKARSGNTARRLQKAAMEALRAGLTQLARHYRGEGRL